MSKPGTNCSRMRIEGQMTTPLPERPSKPASEIIASAGSFEATTSWLTVSQEMIDRFAEATQDFQFIHVDPERAKAETPFGGTIAHGMLTLSLLSRLAIEVLPRPEETAMGINYGFDKVRFLVPVRSGARIRGIFRLVESSMRKEHELLSKFNVTVEIENVDKPALVAEWYTMAVLKPGNGANGV